ncbi:hypothetical protein [Pontiella sp.]|uniref:hypothetical protein n=1 Tax=Pontiella sp. TaxID=2837462 RepID=UPI00356146F1
MKLYAHSNDGPPEGWQPLAEHLDNVAELAAQFAEPFGGEQWARLLCLMVIFGSVRRKKK